MDVIGHNDETVQFKALSVPLLEEHCDEELCVGCALEVAMLLEGRDRDGVCALLLPDCSHGRESIPQGLKPLFVETLERAKPEGLAYLEAKADSSATLRNDKQKNSKEWQTKEQARNDKQENKQEQRHPTLRDETAKDGAPSSFPALRDAASKNGMPSCSAT
jgi:hypothetical protein